MGNSSPNTIEEQSSLQDSFRVTLHHHSNPIELLRIFRLFTATPFNFIEHIEVETYPHNCCDLTELRVTTFRQKFNLDNLAVIKRSQKQGFTEREVWYLIKVSVDFFSFMQANNLALGKMNLKVFLLEGGRFIKMDVLHLLPENEHLQVRDLSNYYSPEMILLLGGQVEQREINLSKSEVFEFGLLLLEILTCPLNKPKFHSSDLGELLWTQINKRVKVVEEQKSDKMNQLIELVLREDLRTRADWNYLKIWLRRNEPYIDVAPCIFWAL